jgi:hypothetical protein
MADFKIPEGEKFFAFVVWVALVGAALILAIDYIMKKQLLDLARELREGGLNEQAIKGRFASAANPHDGKHSSHVSDVSMANDAGVETENAVEHVPFPIRRIDQPRESNGRFAPAQADDSGRVGDSEIPNTNKPVES